MTYTHPDFIAVPSYCPIDYTYNVPALANSGTPITRADKTFTIFYDADLTPVDESPITVTVTGTSRSDKTSFLPAGTPAETKATDSETFDVNFATPCLSDAFATLTLTEDQGDLSFNYDGVSQTFSVPTGIIDPSICDLTVTCNSITPSSTAAKLQCSANEPVNGDITLSFAVSDYTSDNLAPGTYRFTYDVTTGSSDAALNKQFFFDVTIADPCATTTI